MGRALFSNTYATVAPVIRTEPEPKVDICERWSAWNRFDPDSEDFFQNAEYEAFIDPVQFEREQGTMPPLVEGDGQLDSPESSESSVSDQGSPMAVGSDDPAILIADAYTIRAARWEDYNETDISSPSDTEWRATSFIISHSPTDDQTSIPPFIPPVSFREASPAIESVPLPPNDPPRSPTIRRAANITPIVISRTQTEAIDRSPSPDSPSMPSTPPSRATFLPSQTLLTPSPPPSVTPRFYSWQQHSIPALPTSPSLIRGNRDGPLTNPRARMSFARIEASPARIRIPSGVM
ncbi:hypothetical protein CVT25_010706 [Psilocybe cyanescens]|uniref:Uncharacterized protein n=1 Tax=Psilocybe cyanescens TaxID=93625 RepID=A0A409WJK9_PSICY|nr:hypothetical protein CVT25_010706 [Psilocybe cyanescens]